MSFSLSNSGTTESDMSLMLRFAVSIRAYGAQEAFKQESYARMDRYNRAGLTYEALNR